MSKNAPKCFRIKISPVLATAVLRWFSSQQNQFIKEARRNMIITNLEEQGLYYNMKDKKRTKCGGVPSVPTMFPALTVTWPIIPHTCCTYVYTRPSLPILKYTVVARLLTCLHLSTSGDPAFNFTHGHASQHVISTHVHVSEYKTKHVERQRELPAFAHALSCTRLQSTSRPHSFVNIQIGGKRR